MTSTQKRIRNGLLEAVEEKKWEIKCIKKSLPLIKQLNGWENLIH